MYIRNGGGLVIGVIESPTSLVRKCGTRDRELVRVRVRVLLEAVELRARRRFRTRRNAMPAKAIKAIPARKPPTMPMVRNWSFEDVASESEVARVLNMLNLKRGIVRDVDVDVDVATEDEGIVVSEGSEAKSSSVLEEGAFVLVVS